MKRSIRLAVALVCIQATFSISSGCDRAPDDRVDSTGADRTESTAQQQHGESAGAPAAEVGQSNAPKPVPYTLGQGSHPLTYAPDELLAILQGRQCTIDFRYVSQDGYPYDGCHWRLALSDDLVQSHIQRFKLQPAPEGLLTEKLTRLYPSDWPDLTNRQVEWYAWPGNRDHDRSLQFWSVMAVDAEASMLYFFHQNYDVTP